MSRVILSLGEPVLQSFNEYGDFFSVIRKDNNLHYKKMIIRYFTNIYCVPEEYSKYKRIFSFYPNRHEVILNGCPLVESKVIKRKDISFSNEEILDKIRDLILHGYYVTVYVNMYYLPCSEGYQKTHLNHKIMIYGYDDDKEVFYAMDTFRGFKYMSGEIPYSDFITAFLTYENAENQREDDVFSYSYKDQEISLDLDDLKESMKKFYITDKEDTCISGHNVYNLLDKSILNQNFLQPQSIKVLSEHIHFTVLRAGVLAELGVLNISDSDSHKLYFLDKERKTLQNMYMKCLVLYEVKEDKKFKDQLMEKAKQVREFHIDVIQKMVNQL